MAEGEEEEEEEEPAAAAAAVAGEPAAAGRAEAWVDLGCRAVVALLPEVAPLKLEGPLVAQQLGFVAAPWQPGGLELWLRVVRLCS